MIIYVAKTEISIFASAKWTIFSTKYLYGHQIIHEKSSFFLRFLTHHLKYFYEDSMCCNSTSDEIEKWSFLLSKKCEKINFEKAAAFRLKRSEKGNFYARYFSNTFISLHYRISILDHTFVLPFGHYWIFQFDHSVCKLYFSVFR